MRCSVVAHIAARSQQILGELKESCIQLRNNTVAQMLGIHSRSSAAAAAVLLPTEAEVRTKMTNLHLALSDHFSTNSW